MKYGLIFLVIWITCFSACENKLEDFESSHQGPEYFPLNIGNTWIYQIDSVIYDQNGLKIDTVSSRVREIITGTFTELSGDEAFRVERSNLNELTNSWEITDVWSASKTERTAFRVEENIRFAKLNFPVIEDKFWNGNAYLDENMVVKIAGEPIKIFQNWGNYRYNSVGLADVIGENQFDQVCEVIQVDLEDKITRRFSREKYALGVGLVYKEMMILDTQKFDSTDPWEKKAEQGFILIQSLISFTEG